MEAQKIKMTHNEFQEFMKTNASRLYTDPKYRMSDYNRDCDSVEVVDYDLGRFNLSFSGEQLKVINNYFTEERLNPRGRTLLEGHVMTDGAEFRLMERLGIEIVADRGYSGFGRSDANRCIFEFCEGDIYLVLCENQKEYLEEIGSHCKHYTVNRWIFAEGSYTVYQGGNMVDCGDFVGKAFTEQEAKDFIMDILRQDPENAIFTVRQDIKNGYNQSSIDVTGRFDRMLLEESAEYRQIAGFDEYDVAQSAEGDIAMKTETELGAVDNGLKVVCSGDVIIPFDCAELYQDNGRWASIAQTSERIVANRLSAVEGFSDVKVSFFDKYPEGYACSFSFATDHSTDVSDGLLAQAFDGLKFEYNYELDGPALEDTLAGAYERADTSHSFGAEREMEI